MMESRLDILFFCSLVAQNSFVEVNHEFVDSLEGMFSKH